MWQCGDLDAAVSRIVPDRAPTPEQLAIEKILVPGDPVINLRRPGGAVLVGLKVAVGQMVVCVVDVHGRALALDRHSGNMLWQYHCGVAGLTGVIVDDDIVAIAGTTHSAGKVFVLDALTGRLRLSPLRE